MSSINTDADGAPLGSSSVALTHPPLIDRVAKQATRIRSFEGVRGYSLRAQLISRYAGYWLALLVCAAISHWSFKAMPAWSHGGIMMLYSVCAILVVAVVGTVLYAEARDEIVKTAKHYAMGIVALPGAGMALFMRTVSTALQDASSEDMFLSLLRGNALPLMYFTLVVVPVFVYAKYVFGGVRAANRSGLADEEFMATYMRQDGAQR